MQNRFFIISTVVALFMTGCNTLSPLAMQSKKTVQVEKTLKNKLPIGYKLLKLDELHISIVVPKKWKIRKEIVYGKLHYFVGIIKDAPENKIDNAEIWDTFLTNTFNIHGLHIQTIDGSAQSIETELRVNTPSYPILSDKTISKKHYIVRDVLKKNTYSGYYQFYAITSKNNSKRALMIELTSQLYSDKSDAIIFHDKLDQKEIQTIIQSIKPYKDF